MPHYPHICPTCHRQQQDASHSSGEAPKDGDGGICWSCRTLGIFDSTAPGRMRKPTPQELVEYGQDPGFASLQHAMGVSRTPLEAVRRAGYKP